MFPILSPTQPSYDTILNKVALPVSNNVNRRRTANYDDTAYPVYIGVTSDDSTPIPMSFNTKGTGYCVYTANTERLSNITMNTILSFLYKTTAYKGEYDTKRVFYFGRDDSYDADLGFLINPPPKEEQDVYDEYGDEYSEDDADPAFAPKTFLKRYVSSHNVFNDAKDALDALLELYELYGKRRELGYERTEDYPPLLVVLRDLEWLKNLSATVRKCNESGNAARTATYDSIEDDPLYMEILKELEEQREYYPSEAQMRSAARRFYAKRKSSGEEQPKAEKKAYSENEIIKALQTLYQQGAGCRIFTVIASDAKSEFELLTKPPYSLGKSEELSRYVIFGDSSENEDGLFKGDDHYSGRPETCIIYPTPKSNDPDEQEQERKFQSTDMGTLTRLYLFNASADEEWWDKLENRLNGV